MEKEEISIVVLGDFKSGKSTTAGHLLLQQNAVEMRTIERYEYLGQPGRRSYKYAWVLDKLNKERDLALTIDLSYAHFETEKYKVKLIDTPGFPKYRKNTITGISHADVALLVISADSEDFEHGFSDVGYTKELILLAYSFGIREMIVGVNKMDSWCLRYSQDRYELIVEKVKRYVKRVGFDLNKVFFIPISGWAGDNLTRLSDQMKWWKGKTIKEVIDRDLSSPKRPIKSALRISITEIYREKENEHAKKEVKKTVVGGRVASGVLSVGSTVKIAPLDLTLKVTTIEKDRNRVNEAVAGDFIGFSFISEDNLKTKEIKRGMVVGDENLPPSHVVSFIGKVIILDRFKGKIKEGFSPMMFCHSSHFPCKWEKIISKIDRRSGKVIGENKDENEIEEGEEEENEREEMTLEKGESALVRFVPQISISVEEYSSVFPSFGRFVVCDDRLRPT